MKKGYLRTCIYLLVLSLMVPAGGFSQDTGTEPPVFRQEELDQMLAPIALYPDSLLIQILMASTYPLEIVQASRWLNQNPNLNGPQLAAALDQKPWDPSVKSLVNFPDVLAMLNDKLDWTQNLGDAFLGQKDQVMATIQDLRLKAQAAGYLKTNNEQVVVVKEKTIVIEPSSPEVLYIPAYNPMVVYGTWWYPAYPPYYYYPRGYTVAAAGFISFGVGIACGVAWGYAWGHADWHHHNVYVNPVHNVTINNNYYYTNVNKNVHIDNSAHSKSQTVWQHDTNHRRGVAYKDPNIRRQFGQTQSPTANTRQNFRGFDQPGSFHPGNQRNQGNSYPGSMKQGQQQPFNQPTGKTGFKSSDPNQSMKRERTGNFNRQAPTPTQNRSYNGIQNLNRSGSEVNQQSNRGRISRETQPTPQTNQSFQRKNMNPPAGFSNPGANTSGSRRSGGNALPHNSGGGMQQMKGAGSSNNTIPGRGNPGAIKQSTSHPNGSPGRGVSNVPGTGSNRSNFGPNRK